ncbi:HAMP domain-containing histidine kinase [Chitinophaga horti]|uniref:histidine kinase n=1 Tax=Chitinophaga horti TaxID=2920382 RepID=A0ABY6IX99_9BACT|nr:HAMP domain-containing sensor histidine kinase [Chitinophaga horti]UYQ92015.1 HAMP domain-containing histidine kinase [Chitinophaga horti]
MLPLKKTFPLIVVLITLSLAGIIYIQVSWIRNAAVIKREEREQRMIRVMDTVARSMINHPYKSLRMDQVIADSRGIRIQRDITPIFESVSVRFTADEVSALLRKAMSNNKIITDFEFAVVGRERSYQLKSPGFEKMVYNATVVDTNSYRVYGVLLSDMELPTLVAPESLQVIIPEQSPYIFKYLGFMIVGSILFTTIIIMAFSLTIRTLLNQKKLSEIKSDFINNMTHELKTPLATISLAIDAIGNDKVIGNPDKIRQFSSMIKEENKRMNKQVETILQSALMEKEEISLNLQVLDVHELINRTVENLQLQLDSKNGRVDLQLQAIQPILKVDEVHFGNVIFNLLDNAIKYSKDSLDIKIHTHNTRKALVITISDNGIGMSRDTVSRIFEKFYRAHTGNLHNVKGFGLGLSYVKAIVDAHKGKIKAESTLGKGSKFTLEFPQD